MGGEITGAGGLNAGMPIVDGKRVLRNTGPGCLGPLENWPRGWNLDPPLPLGLLAVYETKHNMSRVVKKPALCICKNKDADQLRGNREADQHLCFRYTDSTIPLLPKCEISRLYLSCVVVQPGLCQTWSESPKTGFLTTRLI